MKKHNFIFSFLLFFVMTICGFSQETTNAFFQPKYWLQNFTSSTDANHLLNGHAPLQLSKDKIWTTYDKLRHTNQLFVVVKSNEELPVLFVLGNKKNFFLQSSSFQLNYERNYSIKQFQPTGELLDFFLTDFGKNQLWIVPNDNFQLYELIIDSSVTPKNVNEIRTYLSIKYGINLLETNQYYYNGINLWEKDSNDKNIFGLAVFDKYVLKQLSSTHSRTQDISLSFSESIERKKLSDGSCILLGTNEKDYQFREDVCEKQWTLQSTLSTKIDWQWHISQKEASTQVDYYLLVDKKEYQGKLTDNKVVFQEIDVHIGKQNIQLIRKNAKRIEEVKKDLEEAIVEKTEQSLVQKFENHSSWTVHPNPSKTSSDIYCRFDFPENKKVRLAIYQTDGRFIKQFSEINTATQPTFVFQLDTVGSYMLIAYFEDRVELRKIVVLD